MNSFINNVRATISEYSMIPGGTGVVAGVSGGPDSVAMLHALVRLSKDQRFRVIVAHFDHALRPESSNDACFVCELADKLGLEYRSEIGCVSEYAFSKRISIEEAGRRLRYDFLERTRKQAGVPVIAVGHHVDDQIETFFIRLFKGSSVEGLCGIPPVRGNIVRPLIGVTKKQILSFLKKENISYVVDSTNLEDSTERNFIRNRVFPVIKKGFEGFQNSVHRTIEVLRQENQVVEDMVRQLYKGAVLIHEDCLHLDRKKLLEAPTAVSRRVLMKALYRVAERESRFGQSHLLLVERLLTRQQPSGCLNLPHGIQVQRIYESIFIYQQKKVVPAQSYVLEVDSPCTVDIPYIKAQLRFEVIDLKGVCVNFKNPASVYFDAEQIAFPLCVRGPRPGDRMRPWGFPGQRKIKKFLIEAKIPLHLRGLYPLVVYHDEILWVPLIRRSDIAPITRRTRLVIKVSIKWDTDELFKQFQSILTHGDL